MNRLWVQLALTFGLIVGVTVAAVGLITTYEVNTHFRRFMARFPQSTFVVRLTDYYAEHESWDGVETLFHANTTGPGFWRGGMGAGAGQGMGFGQGQGMGMAGPPSFLLADADGTIVYDSDGARTATQMTSQERGMAVPVTLQDQTIGYLLNDATSTMSIPPFAESFLSSINQSLVQTGLAVGLLAVLVGIAFAWRLSAPLKRLEGAAHQVSQGNLEQRVLVEGSDEVANVARAFNEMATNLQCARQVQQHMIADIAHELRTPLSVLQGNLQAILEDVYPLEKAEIATIYDETLVLSRLVNDLRELARAEARQLSLDMQPVDVLQLVGHSTALFVELASETGVQMTASIVGDIPLVLADTNRVQQVLHNLLSNALRHTPSNGTINVRVETVGGDGREQVRVSVTDSGPGIPAEHLPHVFDRFWRADAARSRDQGGSGLGLAIARQLVEAQGGQIGVESSVGKGSCFWFTLPRYDQSV